MVTHTINQNNAFFISRDLDYAFSPESVLKPKETSYIHTEACTAGKLKHGTIVLITDGVLVIAIVTQDYTFVKTIFNIREVKVRNAFVILLIKEDTVVSGDLVDIHLRIPSLDNDFTVFPIAAVSQLIVYYVFLGRNLDMDQPRSLAELVVVE